MHEFVTQDEEKVMEGAIGIVTMNRELQHVENNIV